MTLPTNKLNYTFLFVSICLISSAIDPIIAKIGYKYLATPYQLIILKTLFGGITLLPLLRRYNWPGTGGVKRITVLAVLLMTISALILISLKFLPAVIVITIITTTPAFVGVVNQMMGKETLGRNFWIGFALCFVGILLSIEIHKINNGSQSLNLIGLICVLASVIISTIYRTHLDEITADYSPLMVSTYMFIINSIIVLPFLPSAMPIRISGWLIGLVLGIAGSIANITFLEAIHLMGSTRMSIIGLLQRPIVIIAAALILKEPLTLIQIIGIIIVFAGIQLAKVKSRQKSS